ncbi:uncharacterized protein LOC131168416 isoform X3 [Malania oleifera]|uniref:uncharacterized protein LOC131168416 isoform X3 n=1 Tax=Malania oleifera TaxID=397392 RepID=UPI0025AE143D|nr:uncharacterized protein LOC131168416 isoform X3 [Malania oleifera]XP_057983800.1 uncharacterized protein LOC131168416 isoform X3 [Malania oleifera]
MSSGEVRRVSRQDIQLVQNLIERCLQLYMNQKEVVATLLDQAKIEPGFTELVHQSSACYAPGHTGPPLKPENMHDPIGSSLPNAFTNGGSSLHTSMHASVDMSAPARIDVPPDLLSTQSSNMGMMQGINGVMIKSETGYAGSSPFMFGADGNVLETRPAIGDGSVASFSSVESSSQPLNEPLLDADTSSFGFLGQIPRNFSLSDLTADFSQSSDILESYSRSPFLASDTDNFLDSRERGEHQGDSKRLDTISEGLSYEDFGSE